MAPPLALATVLVGAAEALAMGAASESQPSHLLIEGAPANGVSGFLVRVERRPAQLVIHIEAAGGQLHPVRLSPRANLPAGLVAELRQGRQVRLATRFRPTGPSHRLEVYADGRLRAVLADDRGARPPVLDGWRLELASADPSDAAQRREPALEVRLAAVGDERVRVRVLEVAAAVAVVAADGHRWQLKVLAATGTTANPRGVSEDAPRVSWVLYPAPGASEP